MPRVAAILLLVALAGCATTNEAESMKPLDAAAETWVRARATYYRDLGWSTLDARDQATHDLEAGKTSPVDRAHMARGRTVN